MINIIRTNSKNTDFRGLIFELDAYLKITDGDDHEFYNQFNTLEKIKNVVIAYQGKNAIGCGKKEHRGTKIASSILNSLEDWASEKGFIKCILETGNNQVAAINFYKKSGYKSIPNYGQYAQMDDSNCFEKLI